MIKKVFVGISLTLTLIAIFTTVVFAWFTMAEYIKPNISGDSVTGYFKDGDGSPEDPYIIESPTHVYNLAWLQYIGLLNQETTDSEGNPIITQYYFKISDEIDVIDMDGVVIPPIGTKDKPFVGHFDGNGKCISNLTVSNYLADGENEFGIEKRPLSVTTIEEDVSIVGFFGVVGALDEETKAKLADDSQIENIEEKVNAVYDLFLDNLTVRTETDRSLIGLFAGYVNGSVTNVGIGESSIEVGEDTTPLTADDVFNMQLTISAYSLIGKYDDINVVWEDKPTGGSGGGSDVGGSGAGWGGSLDMLEMSKRIYYTYGAFGWSQSYSPYVNWVNNPKYGAAIYAQTRTKPSKSSQVLYLSTGTLIPLDVDADILFAGGEIDGVKADLPTTAYYRDNKDLNKEPVLSGNTGYIVGGATATKGIAIRSTYPSVIYKSLGIAKSSSVAFNGDQIQLLTIVPDQNSSNGKTYVIKDDNNANNSTNFGVSLSVETYKNLGLQKYTYVRDTLVNTLNGESYIHALGFNTAISSSELVNADVTILGNEISGYQLLKNAVNFSVKSSGFITAVAGSYRQEQEAVYYHTLFDIYKVDRDSNGKIIATNKIEKIYDKGNGEYEYKYSSGGEISGNCVYDAEQMNVLNNVNAAYYFEIPLNAGEYAIGFPANMGKIGNQSPVGAYLMYLDIGANGAASDSGGDDGPTVVPAHKMTAVTFVDSTAIANKTTENYSVVTFEVKIGEGVTTHGGLSMSFNRTSPTQLIYSQDDPSSAFIVTMVKDDAQLSVEKVQNMLIADFQNRYFRRRDVAI